MKNDHPNGFARFQNQAPDIRLSTFAHYIYGCRTARFDPLKGYSKKAGFDEPVDKTSHLLKRIESIWFVPEYRTNSERMEVFLHHPLKHRRVKILELGFSGFELAQQVPVVFQKVNGDEVRPDYRLLFLKLREMYAAYNEKLGEVQPRVPKPPVMVPSDAFDEDKVFALRKNRFRDVYELRIFVERKKHEGIFPAAQCEAFYHKYSEMFLSGGLPPGFPKFEP